MLWILKIIELIASVLLVFLILVQQKSTWLSLTTFSESFWKFERRWPEKVLHMATIFVWAIFIFNTFLYFLMA